MAVKILKKKFESNNVYEASIDRIRYLYDTFDTITVSFSGGKDSTVCLNLALQVAREKNRLPLKVYFFDEECIHPETIEYIERVRAIPDIEFKWVCLPIMHRNACSRHEPYWFPWAPSEKHRWVRDLPAGAITEHPKFKHGMSMPDMAPYLYGPEHGRIADIRGIRASESIRRYQSVARKELENWISAPRMGYSYPCSPIYDWTTADVWTAPKLLDWDYNQTYDLFEMIGISANDQRVCPPYGEEPLGSLWCYSALWPHLWDKMIARVDGAATAGRYALTELYGYGNIKKPDGMTWREYAYYSLDLYPPALKNKIAQSIAQIIEKHQSKTARPIDDEISDPMSGISWKFLSMIVSRADLKNRRKGMSDKYAIAERNKRGLSIEDLIETETTTRY
jgi:predicted phosphoadenosine phosphosulfate sulfurtransferase